MHSLHKENRIYGSFALEDGRLTFRTGDSALTQRLQADRAAGRASTVCLLSADPYQEFTGRVETVGLVKVDPPQQWQVVIRERRATARSRPEPR